MPEQRCKRRGWTAVEDEVVRRDYPTTETKALAQRLRRSLRSVYARADTLGLAKTPEFMAEQRARLASVLVVAGQSSRFCPGQVPHNKNRKGECAPGCEPTQFQSGHRPHNWRPVGSEFRRGDGYLYRKITDEGPAPYHCRAVHVLLWEEHHGPVPQGHAVVFRDGNTHRIEIDNLMLVDRAELMRRNSIHRYPPELKHAIRLTAKLKRVIQQREAEEDEA